MEYRALSHLYAIPTNQIIYGIKVLPKDDPYIETAKNALASLNIAGAPGAFLVDMLPICMHTNVALGSQQSVSLLIFWQ